MDGVCVIGAGSSGIAACQVLAARGILFDCLEAGSEVGGNWRYRNDNEMSSAYRSLHINTSRDLMQYASYPMPADLPAYPSHFQIARYFDDYVDHFGLRERIRFRTEVLRVAPAPGGGWQVTVRDIGTVVAGAETGGTVRTNSYGAVLVANGHHWDPRYPQPPFPGEDGFAGERLHSHHYKTPEWLANKRVLVLGFGNSACDIAVESSQVAARTVLALRHGAYVFPKFLFGRPTDRLVHPLLTRLTPLPVQRALMGTLLRLKYGSVTAYGLPAPNHKLLAAHPTISEDLLSRLGHGEIAIRPNIARFDKDTVHFTDGSAEPFDVVVYCTGYRISFPFLATDLINPADNVVELYLRVLPPDRPGLYFIGLVQPLGAIMPLAEAQAEWVADLLTGQATLPPVPVMRREIARYHRRTSRRYMPSARHTIQVDFHPYLAELRRERSAGRRRGGVSGSLPGAVSGSLSDDPGRAPTAPRPPRPRPRRS